MSVRHAPRITAGSPDEPIGRPCTKSLTRRTQHLLPRPRDLWVHPGPAPGPAANAHLRSESRGWWGARRMPRTWDRTNGAHRAPLRTPGSGRNRRRSRRPWSAGRAARPSRRGPSRERAAWYPAPGPAPQGRYQGFPESSVGQSVQVDGAGAVAHERRRSERGGSWSLSMTPHEVKPVMRRPSVRPAGEPASGGEEASVSAGRALVVSSALDMRPASISAGQRQCSGPGRT
jgi:hypothetical protein